MHPPNIWRRPSVQYCFEAGLTFVNVKSLIEHKQCDFFSGNCVFLNTHIYCSPTLVTAQNAHLDRLNFSRQANLRKRFFCNLRAETSFKCCKDESHQTVRLQSNFYSHFFFFSTLYSRTKLVVTLEVF